MWGRPAAQVVKLARARRETYAAYVYGVYHPTAVLAFNVGAFWIWRYTFICTCR